ncbi:S-layer homology domain-containing protein [Bacillus fonticola]|uniref:S-layer homology domain-containing protein n=1 Tax=Bacillus fonticola TaxID=2728853 RepID=UPI0014729DA1|nr:S-layer homology domain-containing protein [Bacillus fonticola]
MSIWKKPTAWALVIGLLIPSMTVFASEPKDDITGISLEQEMRGLIEEEVIQGYGEGIYKPFQDISRGEFATYLARALKLPSGSQQFEDVPSSSSLAAGINAAAAADLVTGYNEDEFRPNQTINRQEIALIVSKAMDYLQMPEEQKAIEFLDRAEFTSSVFVKAVYANAYYEIIQGFPEDNDQFTFRPKKEATRAEAAAFVYRLLEAEQNLAAPGEEPGLSYKVGSIASDGTMTYKAGTYTSYEDAESQLDDQYTVISYDDQVVYMEDGLVITKVNPGINQTYVYDSSSLTTMLYGVQGNREMKYLDATEDYVKVSVAGQEVFVKQEQVKLLPKQQIKDRSYFTVDSDGNLVFYVYNFGTERFEGSLAIGPAPSFLKQGVKYTSWDGATFYTLDGKQVGKEYNYFNLLPARTETSYTAEELDSYIEDMLVLVEDRYKKDPKTYIRYKDATTKSKLIGLGEYLKQKEEEENINALLILAMAIHESDFGTSSHAQNNNNLFGIRVFDSNPEDGSSYTTPEKSVDALIEEYLNKNYVNPAGDYANGPNPGNKAMGINVRYASDPHWGLKVAGQMYRADKALGGKDLGKYQIGLTNTTNLNVRTQPSVETSTFLYQYKNSGMAVALLDKTTESDGSIWYKVISDAREAEEAYIYSVYVNEIPITD